VVTALSCAVHKPEERTVELPLPLREHGATYLFPPPFMVCAVRGLELPLSPEQNMLHRPNRLPEPPLEQSDKSVTDTLDWLHAMYEEMGVT